jgi:alpha-tubulin suppressor-like RCC1 family protein
VGEFVGCSRQATGGVVCGSASPELLGVGASRRQSFPAEHPPVVGVEDAVQLAVGKAHSCALRATGTVTCWGQNEFGQLGDGTVRLRSSPVAVHGVQDAVFVAAGASHSCAVLSHGELVCWGANYHGQLGVGHGLWELQAVRVSGIDPVRRVAAGERHTCAELTAGEVWCWGNNDVGQLGRSDRTPYDPTEPTLVADLPPVAELALGVTFTCGREPSGSVVCWGDNSGGALGASTESHPTRARVLGLGDAVQITAGLEHACALRRNGQILCWGANREGELGDGTEVDRYQPVVATPVSDAVSVAAAGGQTCAIRRGGSVACWTREPARAGLNVTNVSGITRARKLALGGVWSCALEDAGSVSCWIGRSDHAESLFGVDDATDLATGWLDPPHSELVCAVRRSGGEVACWTATPENSPSRAKPVRLGGVTDAVQIASAENVLCVRLSDGGVQCWDKPRGRSRRLALIGASYLAVSVGHACVVLDRGQVSCWAVNRRGLGWYHGETGVTQPLGSLPPQPVAGFMAWGARP